MKLLVVGSENPIKLAAARTGASMVLGEGVSVRSRPVSPTVGDQPWGDDETIKGATERARLAIESADQDCLGVGLEGGVFEHDHRLFCGAWCAVANRAGTVGIASTARCELPPEVARLVRAGLELGAADDRVFHQVDSKRSGGAVGLLTRGAIERAHLYAPAVALALTRFLWAEVLPDRGGDAISVPAARQ